MNSADADVEKYLRAFTLLEIADIESIVAQHNEKPELRFGQKQLANYVTQTLFGLEAAQQAEKISEFLFGSSNKIELLSQMSAEEMEALAKETGSCKIKEGEVRILELLVESGLADSNGAAKKLIQQGSIAVNEQKISDMGTIFSQKDAINGVLLLKKGKTFKIAQF